MDIPADKLVSIFIKMRDKRDEIKREMETKVNEIEEQMHIINQQLLEICKTNGADSIRTPHGTAYRTIKQRYWTNDWENFHKFMQEQSAMELLERRIHQSNMKQFLEENPDLHPMGLNVDSEYAITVRRK
jgi:endo-alpha-1,4-polygalactosaminidase (GH114 family)